MVTPRLRTGQFPALLSLLPSSFMLRNLFRPAGSTRCGSGGVGLGGRIAQVRRGEPTFVAESLPLAPRRWLLRVEETRCKEQAAICVRSFRRADDGVSWVVGQVEGSGRRGP